MKTRKSRSPGKEKFRRRLLLKKKKKWRETTR